MKKIFTLFFLTLSLNLSATSFYVNIDEVFPGQLRYSNYNVEKKINEQIEKGQVYWAKESKKWQLHHHNHTSIFPLTESLPAVKAPYGYVLVDGHHYFLTNLALKGTSIPINVIADYSEMSIEDFLDVVEKKGLIHPYDCFGERKKLPTSFQELENDPNRFFAVLCKRVYKDLTDVESSQGNDYPIWIKCGKDIPFIEMKISEALWRAGMVYDETQGLEPDIDFYERARQVILSANIKELKGIPKRTYYREISLLCQ